MQQLQETGKDNCGSMAGRDWGLIMPWLRRAIRDSLTIETTENPAFLPGFLILWPAGAVRPICGPPGAGGPESWSRDLLRQIGRAAFPFPSHLAARWSVAIGWPVARGNRVARGPWPA